MHGLDQCADVLGGRVLRDAMAEVEDVPGIAGSVGVEHLRRLYSNPLGRGKQHVWIEIALQSDPVTNTPARLTDVDRPVEADRVAARGQSVTTKDGAVADGGGGNRRKPKKAKSDEAAAPAEGATADALLA